MALSQLNLFFDVDFTLISSDGSLRPGTRETFQRLTSDGHQIFIWSGVGIRTAEIQRHQLEEFVTDIFVKPQEDFEAGLLTFGVYVRPDFVIDDDARLVMNFGGMLVEPYFFPAESDAEMEKIYSVICSFAETGHSEHAAFRRPRVSRGIA